MKENDMEDEQEIKGGEVAAAAIFVGFILAVIVGVVVFFIWGIG